jgi:hypothetical protein
MIKLDFKRWLEGGWMPDSAAEETTGGVRAKLKSKRGKPMGGGGGMPMGGGMGMGGMPPRMMKKKMKKK